MFASFLSVKYGLVEPWKNSMIIDNCFHADFSQRLRRLVHERDWETFKGRADKGGCLNRRPLLWPQKSFDSEGAWDVFSFTIKVSPSPRPSPHCYSSALSISGRAVKAKWSRERQDNESPPPSREWSFPCVELGPRSDTLTLLPDVKLYTSAEPQQLLPQQNYKPPPPLVSPSLIRL